MKNATVWVVCVACAAMLGGAVHAEGEPAPPKLKVPAEMLRLADLIGEWTVDFESRDSPDEPYTTLSTTSSIVPLLGSAFLQERLSLPTPGGRNIELIGIWGFDRYRSVYRFAWLDDMYRLFDVHEGNWTDGVLVVDNTRARTTLRFDDQEYYSRMRWGPLGPDGFAVESQVSTDGGATWATQSRGRYSRRR